MRRIYFKARIMKTTCKIDCGHKIGRIGEGIFGSFVEHFGRCVYTGIYQPEHITADRAGFRQDVADAVKRLELSYLRWPGGNFVSGYDWKDGIGPISERRVRPDLAWMQIEPNAVGTAEFVDYCQSVGSDVMMAVNLGTGTPKDACELLEYCNFSGGTYYSDLRRKHGYSEPFRIKTWCLGNEMDGDWQICTHTAGEYGRKAAETAKMMKWLDPTVELVACGSSGWLMPSCPEWDRIVLEHTYSYVDYISLHRYYSCEDKSDPKKLTDYLCSCVDMDTYIRAIVAAADYVRALKRGKKDIMLSFDEYNVISSRKMNDKRVTWEVGAPRSESVYDHCDALVFASLLMTLIGHCDRVKLACVAQLVNTLGLIVTEPGTEGRCCMQTIAYPFMLLHRCSGMTLLECPSSCDRKLTSEQYGETDCVKVMAAEDEKGGILLFALNLSGEGAEVEVVLPSAARGFRLRQKSVYAGELSACNTFDDPFCAVTRSENEEKAVEGTFQTDVPGYSLSLFELESMGSGR